MKIKKLKTITKDDAIREAIKQTKTSAPIPEPGKEHEHDFVMTEHLICVDCGKEYPEKATVCPHCGSKNAPIKKQKTVRKDKIMGEAKKIKEWNWKGRKGLDMSVTKDAKLSILKALMSQLKLPNVKPPKFEDLHYETSRYLYKLMTVWNYCLQVEDNYAKSVVYHHHTMDNYRRAIKSALAMAVILSESDSFYRHRLKYFVTLVTTEMILNHYFYMIKQLGLEEYWNKKVIHMKFRTDALSVTRDGKPGKPTAEFGDLFAHLTKYEKGNKVWTDDKGRPLLRDDSDKSFKVNKLVKDKE